MASEPRTDRSASRFRMRHAVAVDIDAPVERVWALLTRAEDVPRWNSTVTQLEGRIAAGERLQLRVPSAPARTFKPTVVDFEPLHRMVWAEGGAPMFKGVRTFRVAPAEGRGTRFEMDEELSGLMLPLVRRSLPDFEPIFARYASDLKQEAERSR